MDCCRARKRSFATRLRVARRSMCTRLACTAKLSTARTGASRPCGVENCHRHLQLLQVRFAAKALLGGWAQAHVEFVSPGAAARGALVLLMARSFFVPQAALLAFDTPWILIGTHCLMVGPHHGVSCTNPVHAEVHYRVFPQLTPLPLQNAEPAIHAPTAEERPALGL